MGKLKRKTDEGWPALWPDTPRSRMTDVSFIAGGGNSGRCCGRCAHAQFISESGRLLCCEMSLECDVGDVCSSFVKWE